MTLERMNKGKNGGNLFACHIELCVATCYNFVLYCSVINTYWITNFYFITGLAGLIRDHFILLINIFCEHSKIITNYFRIINIYIKSV